MHNSTKMIADYLASNLKTKEITVYEYDLSNTSFDEISMHLVDACTLIIGTPCVLGGIHPKVMTAVYLINALKPKTKFVSIIGSYGWGENIADDVSSNLKYLTAEFISPVIIKGLPKENDFKELEKLAKLIFEKHKTITKKNIK